MEIIIKHKIFDDPEYCQNENNKCKYIVPLYYSSVMQCGIFCFKLNNKSKKDKRISHFHLKCQECKDFYKEAEIRRTVIKSCNNLISTIIRDTSKENREGLPD